MPRNHHDRRWVLRQRTGSTAMRILTGRSGDPDSAVLKLVNGVSSMSDKSPRKAAAKKPGRTLKEKRTAKKLKKSDKAKPFLTPGQ